MSSKNVARLVTAQAQTILSRIGIMENPYLQALQDGSMSLQQFQKTQEQFYFAVVFYPRPMSALVARIPTPETRLDILHNVVEEHGEFREKAFHHLTFKRFLQTIGSKPDQLNSLTLWPSLRAFNSVLITACVFDEIEVGVSCMGIIEYAFAGISEVIGKAAVQRGWVSKKNLVHYSLHAKLDQKHAADFFAVVEPMWKDKKRRYFINQGLELGAYIFNRLYQDLYRSVI